MGTNCASLFVDLFLYAYEADFMHGLLKEKWKPGTFYFTFCYIVYVLSTNKNKLGDYVNRIYPIGLDIKDTTDTSRFAACFDIHIEIGKWEQHKNKSLRQRWCFQSSHCKFFHLYEATSQQHLDMEFISFNWFDIPDIVGLIVIFLIEGCC